MSLLWNLDLTSSLLPRYGRLQIKFVRLLAPASLSTTFFAGNKRSFGMVICTMVKLKKLAFAQQIVTGAFINGALIGGALVACAVMASRARSNDGAVRQGSKNVSSPEQ